MADWTPERIAELKALCEAQPEFAVIPSMNGYALLGILAGGVFTCAPPEMPASVATWIVAARAALPEALARIEEQAERIMFLEDAWLRSEGIAKDGHLRPTEQNWVQLLDEYWAELAALRQHALSAAEAERLLHALPCKEEHCECGGYELAQKLAALKLRAEEGRNG